MKSFLVPRQRQLDVCLAFPGKIVKIEGKFASVDYGADGIRDHINISLVDAELGRYVLVQGGFVIRILSETEAKESLDAWKMIMGDLQATRTEAVRR
jgi:hydrogenase expression/formation protein HypC